MPELTILKTEWALGLYGSVPIERRDEVFSICYKFFLELCSEVNIEPTYLGAEGPGYTGEYVKFGGRVHKKLINTRFDKITCLSLTVNPNGSDEPSYDRYAACSVNLDESGHLDLCLLFNEGLVEFNSVEAIINRLLKMDIWSYGYAFTDLISRQPDFHVLGIDNGELDSQEHAALTAWYCAQPNEREMKLRDVYPIMILNQKQLDFTNRSGDTLRRLIEECKGRKTTVGDLLIWVIPSDQLTDIRSYLARHGALIAR